MSDYDLADPSGRSELETTLESLAKEADGEDPATFDPSGSHNVHKLSDSDSPSRRARSWHGDMRSEATDVSATSDSLLLLDLNHKPSEHAESCSNRPPFDVAGMSPDDPEAMLVKMFPTIKQQDITYFFRKSGGNVERSIEEFLNYAFLDESSTGPEAMSRRGIEAFDASYVESRKRGRKARRAKRTPLRRTSSTPGLDADALNSQRAAENRWERTKEDVDFVTQRTHLNAKTVSSMYHASRGSLATTISVLSMLPTTELENPYLEGASPALLDDHSRELIRDFPSLTISQSLTLISITHPSTASAHELAKAMSQTEYVDPTLQPTYIPFTPSPPSTPGPVIASAGTTLDPSLSPTQLRSAKSNAHDNAARNYRASKSGKPLMAQAAGYYSSVARTATATLLAQQSAAADARVSSQSKAGEVDLHGLNIKDAIRVAKDRTAVWWGSGASEWTREGKVMNGSGLRIIVGLGRHSEGGKGRLGPAVGKALVADGWKVEIGQGALTVVGRMRR